MRLLAPGLRRRPAAERRAQRLETLEGIGDERQAAVLGGVEARGVEADDAQILVAEDRPRAGGEVLQPRADGQHDIGARGQLVGLRAAGHADRARVERVVGDERRLARHGLDHGHAVLLGEAAQPRLGERVVHAAAGHDQRAPRRSRSASAAAASSR